MPVKNTSPFEELLNSYLDRENANTARHYGASIEDFCGFIKAPDRLSAIERLLGAGFAAGNDLVSRDGLKPASVGRAKPATLSGCGVW